LKRGVVQEADVVEGGLEKFEVCLNNILRVEVT